MPLNRANQPNQLKHKAINPQKALPYIIHFVLCPVGRAFVRFVVKKDGSIDNVEILKSSRNSELDKEALRLMNDEDMPQWVPATQFIEAEGKYIKVDSRLVMPIVFKLENLPTCTNLK